ncbi:Zinc carboxypeptidase-related protein [Marinobacter nitratireducens]|uniref:Zinc carboxypeptidase-related protein n=1 Tax=Marinobacter nitratireducens TaxID=1137280 RepID=A0A072NCF9_9GAMM|nr:M14 family zinc carboxypeptidase [Marinobacter nitratireducens]KEF30790.1 Zinc carboxypeptidase-related protein [Marinobacter nitratireducens]
MTELRAITPHAAIPAEQATRDSRQRRLLRLFLPEMIQLERLLAEAPDLISTSVVDRVGLKDLALPIYRADLGSDRPDAPVILLVGGVHGLERIGSQVVLAWLGSALARLRWDDSFRQLLERVRITVLPILNPGGMYLNQRSNPNGVDLMRNAPITAQDRSAFLLGGQRLSPRLPWYTGDPEQGMEAENQALESVIRELLPGRPFSLALDCHSGFGWQDQIWFPYAYRRRPMRRIASVMALKLIWEQAYPNHDYQFEPQSRHYLTHGDLWDYFYKQINRDNAGVFLPLTLEMGSWRWIRKRPRQLLRLQGFFNPLVPHRHKRVLRTHLTWIDFLMHAAASHENWLPAREEESMLREAAIMHWYRDQP